MRKALMRCAAGSAIALILLSVLTVTSPVAIGDGPTAGQAILRVGMQYKMKTRNPLPALADDIPTRAVLDRVYDTLGKVAPETEKLLPYIIKGVDANRDGAFQVNEHGVFSNDPKADPLDVTAYYDFNGVYFHDGVQANASDLFFSYQLQAMNPRSRIDLQVLMDKAGKAGSNYSQTRWLFVTLAPKTWDNEPTAGDSNLRYAVRFRLQEPFALFARSSLVDVVLYPRHVWEGVGWRQNETSVVTPLHEDFGRAIYPESDPRFGQGIPAGDPNWYRYNEPATTKPDSAEEWNPTNDDVIGTGPFDFLAFDEVTQQASVATFSDYYCGNDTKTGSAIDPYVSTYINKPHIDGISFSPYPSLAQGVLALKSGQIDFYLADLSPDFIPGLMVDPNMTIWMSSDPGFSYLAYNMRKWAVGTYNWGQTSQFDIGLHFRRAVAHLIDKTTIVETFLQGYGVPGVIPVSPNNMRFYNTSLTGYAFVEQAARDEIGLAHQDALWLASQPGSPPDTSLWYTWGTDDKLYMPGIGTAPFDLWCPNADYDPVRANSCTMIATEMNKLGIQIVARPVVYSTIIQKIDARDFDMFILGWRLGTSDPDYLYNFFHSSNAALGQNYPSFNEAISDWILEDSRKQLNETSRADCVKWEEKVLLDKLPYDTLYFRTRIEATRNDKFEGWIRDVGTIWNYWSLLNLTPLSTTPPTITIASPVGGEVWMQGSYHDVTWTASDNEDAPPDLLVWINYTSSAGSGNICGPVTGNIGTCAWTLPTIAATDVVVNGTAIDTGGLKGYDESGPFTIEPPPPVNTPPTVTITSPTGGEEFAKGSSHTIMWTMHDNEDVNANLTIYVNYTTGGITSQVVAALKGELFFTWILPSTEASDVVVNITVIDTGDLKNWSQSGPFATKAPKPPIHETDYGPLTAVVSVVVVAVVAVLLLLLLLLKRKKRKEKEAPPSKQESPPPSE